MSQSAQKDPIHTKKLLHALKKSFKQSEGKKKTLHAQMLENTINAANHFLDDNHDLAREIMRGIHKKLKLPFDDDLELKNSFVVVASYVSENEIELSHLSIELVHIVSEHL